MIYLAIQVLFWMLGAFILGIATGWWMKKSLWTPHTEKPNTLGSNPSCNHEPELADMQNRLREKHQKIEVLEKELAQWQPADSVTNKDMTLQNSDDLKKIFGIGKVIESKLIAIGITKFEHVAKLSAKDVDQVAKKLETFRDRIDRDNWIASAKKCHYEKYGEKV